jgi:hypothetical protein
MQESVIGSNVCDGHEKKESKFVRYEKYLADLKQRKYAVLRVPLQEF